MKPPTACYYIENKSYFLPPPADGFEAPDEPLTTPSWCVQTQEPIGPDGECVGAELCTSKRSCFKPEVDL